MKQPWLGHVFSIATLFSFRMLGLFMLIPIFTVYATNLTAATPTLIGVALGAYGLSQGLLQIPLGMLSDRFGRKPILILGFLLFAIGSLLGALTTSIYGMIFARMMQGMGAVGSVLIALLSDLTPDEHRAKSMAIIGVTIGLSFSLAMVISAPIAHHFGLTGIFYFTTLLALLGLLILHTVIPTPNKEHFHLDSEANPKLFTQVIRNQHLQRLNAGIFIQHFILTGTFFSIPMILQQHIKQGVLTQQWHFYLPLMLLAFVSMIPFLTLAEKKQQVKLVFIGSIIVTASSQLLLAFTYQSWLAICILMFIYFVGFNILEASLPTLISRQSNPNSKGTAMGIYSSSQFLGIFAGGLAAGLTYQRLGNLGVFLINANFALIWLIIASTMKPQLYQLTIILPYDNTLTNTTDLKYQLEALPGINQVAFAHEESTLYIQINKACYKEGSADELINQFSKPN